ncbi:MAG: hypothetical protein OEY14_09640 [Myxococcales bacterium]|nr:hypothetical protein [Myxococcales bacterium]
MDPNRRDETRALAAEREAEFGWADPNTGAAQPCQGGAAPMPAAGPPYRVGADPAPVAEPFSRAELLEAMRRPARLIDLILAERARWMRTVSQGQNAALLAALMGLAGLLFALPYGLVLGLDRAWHIAALFLGSVAICWPSLHIFGSYLGLRVETGQSLALGLLVGAVASIFSLGFAPILWFLGATMDPRISAMTLGTISALLLGVALLVGLAQLRRCLKLRRADPSLGWLMVIWQGLVLFITYRMGCYLGFG